MSDRMKDVLDDIQKKYGETLRDLANCISCAKCKKKVCGEKFNLGPKYNSFEGCEQCAKEGKEDV